MRIGSRQIETIAMHIPSVLQSSCAPKRESSVLVYLGTVCSAGHQDGPFMDFVRFILSGAFRVRITPPRDIAFEFDEDRFDPSQ